MLYREYRSDYFKVVVPVTMQTFLTAVLTATDTIMVGMLNSTSLAAVSLASQVTLIITNLIAAISVGTSALASQYYGKKDMESVKRSCIRPSGSP
jgi:Na+-driven multidrug efflux pump